MANSLPNLDDTSNSNEAAALVRRKLKQIYSDEPDATEELQEAQAAGAHRSKHQQFMYGLNSSGKSLAEIQTEWHNYYVGLSDEEKHRVWQEFYQEHGRSGSQAHTNPSAQPGEPKQHHTLVKHPVAAHQDPRTVADIHEQIVHKVERRTRKKQSGHLKSLGFGLVSGVIAVVVLLFSFFNERFIAPFINPSKNVSDSSIIIDPSSTSVGTDSKIIIPKINVEIPVVYDVPTVEENAIQAGLERGVVHYATTPNPGEKGNGIIFGHSSNNILNKGKYKFAFVLLKRLEVGDTFILQKGGKRYIYRVFTKKVVKPTDVGVLTENTGKVGSFSLITCDPPGTTLNRLVVTGEQITPDPAENTASTAKQPTAAPALVPGNSESLWHRFVKWLST